MDDVQALAMLHAYQRAGRIELLGVIVTSDDSASFSCTDAINTFYGQPDLPIGFLKTQPRLRNFSKYTRQVAQEFPHSLNRPQQTIEASHLYRKLLAASPDTSVVLVTVGHLTSLQNLLQSGADRTSPLSGQDLVRKKVKRWICMGGQYPAGKEANFYRPDPQSTRYCLDHWELEAVFCGWEVGHQILTGGPYLKGHLPHSNPVYRAYELYNNFKGRPAWDQVAVLLLDDQAKTYFNFITNGQVEVATDGSNRWIPGESKPRKNHTYVRIKEGIPPDSIARYIDDVVLSIESPMPKTR